MVASAFEKLHPIRVLVVGDFMVDHYTLGKIERISPEAPVPILHVEQESSRPGGAGNVALNLRALGAQVSVMGALGDDKEGHLLVSFLEKENIDIEALFLDASLKTIVKKRLIADGQHLMRLDYETRCTLNEALTRSIVAKFEKMIDQIDIVAISDYAKGFLTEEILSKLIALANQRAIPILVDPKGSDFTKYRGATLIKPNQKEAYQAAGCDDEVPIDVVAQKLIQTAQLKHLIITRSAKGISLFDSEGQRDFPVEAQEVMDVTGAGDTVLAVLTFAVANNLTYDEAIRLANLASGIAIGRLGCAHITLSEIAHRLLEVATDNKIFDEDHHFALKQVLLGETYALLSIDDGKTGFDLLDHIHAIKKQHPQSKLLIYLDSHELATHISSFTEVDFVILKKEGISHLIAQLDPIGIYCYQEGKVVELRHIDQVFERQVVK